MVRTEFFLWNGYTLIAHIGGACGLTLGLCFLGAIHWLSDKLNAMWEQSKYRKSSINITSTLTQVKISDKANYETHKK